MARLDRVKHSKRNSISRSNHVYISRRFLLAFVNSETVDEKIAVRQSSEFLAMS